MGRRAVILSLDEALEKAEVQVHPFVRMRQGKLEKVGGYVRHSPDVLKIKDRDMEHARKRIREARRDPGFIEKMRLRMKRITEPKKMYAFAIALENENYHGLAEEAYKKLKEMGYDIAGRKLAVEKADGRRKWRKF